MFSVCEMPPSPWQPTQSSAFSLPAAESAAWAGTPASADNPSARPYSVSNTNRRRIIGIPDTQLVIPGRASAQTRNLALIISRFRIRAFHARSGMTVLGTERCTTAFKNAKLRPLGNEWPQPLNAPSLLLVADAVDRTGPVVGDEDRTILGDNDIRRPAEIILVTLKP